MALAASPWIQRAFYPYAIFFQIVPIVAIAPLLVIWFGYGPRAVVAAAAVVSVFPVIANTLAGLLSVDPNLRDLFRLHGASRCATLWKLRLPWALPYLLTGLRIAAGLAVIGAIVGEFVGGGGLGVVVLGAMRQQRTDLVFAAVGYASLLGLALFARGRPREPARAAPLACLGGESMTRMAAAALLALGCSRPARRTRRSSKLALNWKPEPEFGGIFEAERLRRRSRSAASPSSAPAAPARRSCRW